MDLELKWRDLTWFEVLGRATATHEEALETAIPEYCPDMNRIVDATGQLQIRDREITGGAVMVSGMVSVRVLYSSEESSGLRSLEVSVPFRCTQEGGNLAACRVLRAEGRLLLTEAKAVSARRLYVRVLPEVTVTGYGEMHGRLCCAAEGDASLAVRTRETPLRLLSAVAEKQCPFTQETMLQTGQETPEEVLADRLTLRVTDWQNVGTKLLVKGEARLCVLYRGEQQGLCIHEAALPFSQILDGIEAAEDGECAVEPLVIEAQTRVLRTEGACGFGVSAQVSLFVRQWRQERVQLVEDLYSTRADTAIRREPVRIAFERPLPPVEQETVQKLEFGRGQPLVYLTELECSPVSQAPEGDHNTLRTTVRMKLVYQDESGSPISAERTAEVSAPMSAAPDAVFARCGQAECRPTAGGCELHIPVQMHMVRREQTQLDAICGAELSEPAEQERAPSLVLRRMAPGETLWDVAKQYHTREELIRGANRLEEDDDHPAGMLLIPRAR